jgi:uncharacterized membrane protein
MNISTFLWTAFWAFLPISELRGAIPFAVANGMPLPAAFVYCVAINALVAPAAWIFLVFFHKILYRWKFYARIFDRLVRRARVKVSAVVEKYGYLGIMVFVAIPLPLTGAWTGILGGWVLGMEPKKLLPAAMLGVFIAGCIVSLIVFSGTTALSFFLKRV